MRSCKTITPSFPNCRLFLQIQIHNFCYVYLDTIIIQVHDKIYVSRFAKIICIIKRREYFFFYIYALIYFLLQINHDFVNLDCASRNIRYKRDICKYATNIMMVCGQINLQSVISMRCRFEMPSYLQMLIICGLYEHG